MGSSLTRHFRDLSDFGGFEAPTVPMVASTSSPNEKSTTSDSRPSTPITHQTVHVLDWDPRSPTSEIVRTPIEISSKNYLRSTQDSPSIGVVHSLKSYLETDLDTLSTRAEVRNENGASQSGSSLPPGLTSSHLMKLKFLGIDPRSPSSDIARTPIQPGKLNQRDEGPFHFDDTLSIGSVSSHDIFNNSLGSSDFIRDCSDPSAFISENEDLSDKDDSLHEKSQEYVVEADGKPKADSFVSHSLAREESNGSEEGVIKPASKVSVFQEDITIECMDRIKTPESIKKSTGHRTRTPLTPICNHSQTPNSILRAKQSLTIEKEILTKAKIYSAEESVTPSKSRSISSAKKENTSGRSRKGLVCKSENLPVVNSKTRSLAQWDQDNSVII